MKTISKSEKSDVTAKKLGKTRGKNCFFIKKFESALKNIILLLILGGCKNYEWQELFIFI